MTINKILQIIRTQPILFTAIFAIAAGVIITVSLNRPPKKRPIYQWERDSDQLQRQIEQFSDLAQPSRKH